ncbi:basic leucine zipper 19-like [Nicotiana tomentosiformis]|uniref:basic leucine zipper 19-like n=1 Tax=Nicotiana tomentosiformis TaxID=4098 RepID=UPI00051B2531|nr:basic leucine zipper 19-like [Nicotiana tomentosiformis]
MEDKRKRSEPELALSLKSPTDNQDELPVNRRKVPLTLDQAIDFELNKPGRNVDSDVDLKKLRRTVSNRLSAQRSRIKKTEYITELEKKVKDLQDTIAYLSPEIENYKEKQTMLRMQRKYLQEQLDSFTDRSKLRTVQIEEMKLELRRLKELAKAQEEHYNMQLGQTSNYFYQSEMELQQAAAGIDQYLNLDVMNFYPPKNEM